MDTVKTSFSEMKVIIKSLVVSSPKILDLTTLDADFNKSVGCSIPFRQYGFDSLITFLQSMPDTINIVKSCSGNTYVTLAHNDADKSKHIQYMVSMQKKTNSSKIRHRLNYNSLTLNNQLSSLSIQSSENKHNNLQKETIKINDSETKVVSNTSETDDIFNMSGSVEKDIKTANDDTYINENNDLFTESETNDTEEYEEEDIEDESKTEDADNKTESCDNKCNIFSQSSTESTNECKHQNETKEMHQVVFSMSSSDTCCFQCSKGKTSEESLQENGDSVQSDDDGNPYVNFLEKVRPNDIEIEYDISIPVISDYMKISTNGRTYTYDIIITNIHNPHRFWFRMKSTDIEFRNLMYELMEHCRKTTNNIWKVKTSKLEVGKCYCIPYQANWYRAKYLKNDGILAHMYLVDFGKIVSVNLKNISYLPKKFGELPMQALRGTIEGIGPLSLFWDTEGLEMFETMAKRSTAHQIIVQSITDNIAYCLIFFWDGGRNFQLVNETMLDENVAIYLPTNSHFQNYFPTFEMLENDEYPSMTEINFLNKEYGLQFFESLKTLFANVENAPISELRRLFLHYKKPLMTTPYFRIDSDCLVMKQVTKNLSNPSTPSSTDTLTKQLNQVENVSTTDSIDEKIRLWVNEYNKRHQFNQNIFKKNFIRK